MSKGMLYIDMLIPGTNEWDWDTTKADYVAALSLIHKESGLRMRWAGSKVDD